MKPQSSIPASQLPAESHATAASQEQHVQTAEGVHLKPAAQHTSQKIEQMAQLGSSNITAKDLDSHEIAQRDTRQDPADSSILKKECTSL